LTELTPESDALPMATIETGNDGNTNRWPADGLENVPRCPVCGSSERQPAYTGLTDRVFRCAPGEWNLQRCENCGSGYLDPRPTPETIGLAYSRYYTHGPTGGVEPEKASRWRRFRMAQRNSFLNAHYGYDLKPTAWSPFFLTSSRRRRLDGATGYLHFPGPSARVLDIGCANGSFLRQLRSLGWEVCGVEPDPKSAAQAREAGLDVREGLLPQQSFPEAHFDAITMSHVIEHLHDPVDTLRRCWKLLKPGGQITIMTPNFGARGRDYFGRDWMALDPPRHLVLFTESSLRRAMEDCGFAVSRPPQPSLKARDTFKQSFIVRRGGDPMSRRSKLPWSLRLTVMRLASEANRAAQLDPSCTEELVLLGRK